MKYRKIHCLIWLLIFCGSLFVVSAAGRIQSKHEVFISGGVGLNSLRYDALFGDKSTKLGGMAGLGYGYFFTEHWGIVTGVDVSFYKMEFSMGGEEFVTEDLRDMAGRRYDLHTLVENYEEKLDLILLNVPLMAIYQYGKWTKFYAMGGVKVGFPFGKYNSKGTFVNRGYFPDFENWAIDQEFMGFGRFTDRKSSGSYSFRPVFTLSLETGVKWSFGDDVGMYIGIFGDLGLNDMLKNKERKNFLSHTVNSEGVSWENESVFNAFVQQNGEKNNITGKVIPYSFGLKLRFSFGWGFK